MPNFTRHQIARWMQSANEPRLAEWLALIETLSHRVLDLVAAFFGERFNSPRVQAVAGITIILALGGYLLAVTQGAGILLTQLTDLTYVQGLIIAWLSYTTFNYDTLTITPETDGSVTVTVNITNTGDVEGDEIVQVYVSDLVTSATWVPLW